MKIMASVSGYSGDSVTLLALLDPATGVLAIAKKTRDFREVADEGYAFVTNTRTDAYDCLFTEDHWAQAIRDYQVAEGNETVKLGDEAARFSPRIETDGVDDRGQKYRLHADLTNGEVAVLALVHFQQRQLAISAVDSVMDEWFDLITV
ncbi:hypothetical protein KVG88_30455 [Pseudomonas sp. SWRI74]|uniref:Uncharacterized protein n=1 Tax=Pseudomonas azerbaijanoccidentalis TaxID=2842347 RepID=A0ABS6QZU1_9PSED|nr:hypothetical protein [Pseudomonas azerbaijanoccidentalis]MBV4524399.1 hypothetical protein [Pseudomonas azerbaijanoccidentalis]